MPNPLAKDTPIPIDVQPPTQPQERRSQPRVESVLGKIEDTTYAILRKHENKSA